MPRRRQVQLACASSARPWRAQLLASCRPSRFQASSGSGAANMGARVLLRVVVAEAHKHCAPQFRSCGIPFKCSQIMARHSSSTTLISIEGCLVSCALRVSVDVATYPASPTRPLLENDVSDMPLNIGSCFWCATNKLTCIFRDIILCIRQSNSTSRRQCSICANSWNTSYHFLADCDFPNRRQHKRRHIFVTKLFGR
jgi:hypothetical protein